MARLRVRDLGGDFAGDGPDPLLRMLARVVGMVFDGDRWWMGSQCVSGWVNAGGCGWLRVRLFV